MRCKTTVSLVFSKVLIYFCRMNYEDIKRHFEAVPPPEELEWKPWAKITDTQLFLRSCYIGIQNFNGPVERCPAWWHLKDFYLQLKRGAAQETPAAEQNVEA